jgi:CubicO group peptidase (beta-lactamase class C family)
MASHSNERLRVSIDCVPSDYQLVVHNFFTTFRHHTIMRSLPILLFTYTSFMLLAQPSAVDSLVHEFIRSFNAGDAEMQAFFQEHAVPDPPVDQRMSRYRRDKAQFGTLTLKSLTSDTPRSATAVITGSTGAQLTMGFQFDAVTEPKLAGLFIKLGRREDPAEPTGAALSEADTLKEIAAAIDKHSQADDFSGAVLVAHGDQILFERAAGFLDHNAESPNRKDTLFNIGSIVKLMTKFCIAQLWEEGKLLLDDKIGKFLPDYPNREAAASVTVRHLLTMTSGIGDFFGPKYAATPKNLIQNLADHLAFFAAEPLAFRPGTSEKYSNGGYLVLGLIIEKLTGSSYYDFVAKTIFEPLGMKDTGFYEIDVPRPRLATGYAGAPGSPRRSNIYTLSRRGSSAGGAYSTARDLFLFARAIQSRKLEPKKAPEEFRMSESFSFSGGAPGVNAVMTAIPGGYTVVVLANYDPPSATDIGSEIGRILRRMTR